MLSCFGRTYTKIGTIQRRLAWPLRKDDTQNREAFHIFCVRIKRIFILLFMKKTQKCFFEPQNEIIGLLRQTFVKWRSRDRIRSWPFSQIWSFKVSWKKNIVTNLFEQFSSFLKHFFEQFGSIIRTCCCYSAKFLNLRMTFNKSFLVFP